MTDGPEEPRDDTANAPPARTPEEVAAFEDEVRTIVGYEGLVLADAVQQQEELDDALREAEARGDAVTAAVVEEKRRRLGLSTFLFLAFLLAVLIAALVFYMTRGDDLIGTATDGGTSTSVDAIAPPEPAGEPAAVLPPEVFTYTCADCGDTTVTQVPLELNEAAKYQFAYEAGGSRIAIFSVVDGGEYDALATSLEDAYAKAQTDGLETEAPKYLDDIGDGAVLYDTTVVFRNGDDCGVLWANTLQDAVGEVSVAISPEELERLARIAAPRM